MKSVFLPLLLAAVISGPMPESANAQDTLMVWREFVSSLIAGTITTEKIRPYEGVSAETLLGWLRIIATEVPNEQLATPPEAHQVGDHLHYLKTLDSSTFCFTFLIDSNTWYFRHIETIFIRLDQIDSLPASVFPEIPEQQKAWMREEIYWSQQVYFYNLVAQEKGRDVALNRFKDGRGYFLAAKTWVPFVLPTRAFVLYACWEQANLRGNSVVLQRLVDTAAVISFPRVLYFEIYQRASHLKERITLADYRRIFETIWQDRAAGAGWHLVVEYPTEIGCVFQLTR